MGARGAPIRVAFFDDRLEIENPSLLPFGLTLQDRHDGVSRLRNRVIGRVFQELGFIEQHGNLAYAQQLCGVRARDGVFLLVWISLTSSRLEVVPCSMGKSKRRAVKWLLEPST